MSAAADTQKVITFKNIAQRAIRIPPPDYFEWLKPRLTQASAGKGKHKLRKISPEDCMYNISKDDDSIPRFGELDSAQTHKLEVVESEVAINSQDLTAQGKTLKRPDYHMDDLDRFNDREGSYISILNECLQKTKNPNIAINPELNQSTNPPTFKCSPEANGMIVGFVSGNAANKAEAKSYIAKFLLRELFPVVHEQTERFFREKKENMDKVNPFKDHGPASKGSAVQPIRDKFQAAATEKTQQLTAVNTPNITNMLLEKKLPEMNYVKHKTAEAEKSEKEKAADAKAVLDKILESRGGVASNLPGLDDSEISDVSNDRTYLLNQSGFEYQRIHEQGNAHIPRAEVEDMTPSKWPGIPLNTLVTNFELLETFKKDFLGKRDSFLKLAELKKTNKLVEATKLVRGQHSGKYSFESITEQQQIFRLVMHTPGKLPETVMGYAEHINSSIGKERVIENIIMAFQY